MNGEQLVIETVGLSKQYKGVTALQGLNLQVAQHSISGWANWPRIRATTRT